VQICTINSDGSGLTQLTKDAMMKSRPSWSPDGKKIAYSAYTGDVAKDRDIFLINADGTNQVDITNFRGLDDYPSWSPILK
jgi:TolB protein